MRGNNSYINTTSNVFTILNRAYKLLDKKEQYKVLIVIGIQIFLSFLDLLGVALFGILGTLTINGLTQNAAGDRTKSALQILRLIDNNLEYQIIFIAILGTFLLTAKTIFSLYFTRKSLHFLSRRSAQISSQLISKLLAQSLLFVQNKSTQNTIHMATDGVSSITLGIIGSLIYLISDVALLLVLILGLFLVDPVVSLLTFIIFGGVAISLFKLMHHKMGYFGKVQYELEVKSAEKIGEIITSYRELFVKNRRSYYASQVRELRFELSEANAELTFYQRISKYVLEITMIIGVLLIAIVQFSTQPTSRAVGVIAIFLIASTRIGPAVLRIQQVFLSIKSSYAAAGPTFDFLDELNYGDSESEIDLPIDTVHTGFKGQVSLQNLSFTYNKNSSFAISNLNLEISEGSICSIVGPSGAGKTTLIDLILGILAPTSGAVLINNCKPVTAIKKWPGALAYVPQDTIIINGTIKENIALGYPMSEIQDERINEALRISQLTEFVANLPEGVNSYVGDRGVKISGGQRQRLGIARALYSNPSMLLLDEATSSLDGITEANLSSAVQSMRGKVTVIMIAHRLSTVRNSDIVVYMEAGKIQSQGTFNYVREKVPDFDLQAKLMGL